MMDWIVQYDTGEYEWFDTGEEAKKDLYDSSYNGVVAKIVYTSKYEITDRKEDHAVCGECGCFGESCDGVSYRNICNKDEWWYGDSMDFVGDFAWNEVCSVVSGELGFLRTDPEENIIVYEETLDSAKEYLKDNALDDDGLFPNEMVDGHWFIAEIIYKKGGQR